MYSRYPNYRFGQGVRVPENYSGNAFSAVQPPEQSLPDESEVQKAPEKETSDPAIIYDDAETTDETVRSEDISVSRIEKQKRRPFAPFGFKFDLGHIFSHGFGFEELLLIALILLVAQSDTQDDLLIFLAVLIFIG